MPYTLFKDLIALLKTLVGNNYPLPQKLEAIVADVISPSMPELLEKHQANIDYKSWREDLLKMQAWDDEEIEALEEGRRFINQWQPQQFF